MIYDSITELIGGTPLLRLNRYCRANGLNAEIIAKLEYFNPAGSVKDRVALNMVLDAHFRQHRHRACAGRGGKGV